MHRIRRASARFFFVFIFAVPFIAAALAPLPECSAAERRGISLSIATGGTAGLYYSVGEALAKLLSRSLPDVEATAGAGGGSAANLASVAEGRASLALVQSNALFHYGTAGNPSASSPASLSSSDVRQNVRWIAPLYPEYVHCLTVRSSDVKRFSQLKGKRVSVGTNLRSVDEVPALLSAAGLRYADINAEFLDFSGTAERLFRGESDAGFATGGIPLPAVAALTKQKTIDLIALEDALLDAVIAKYPFFSRGRIPAGTYGGIDRDTPALALWAVLVCDAKLPDERVYSITKALFENVTELKAIHPEIDFLPSGFSAAASSVAPHPGAVKYFEENALNWR